MNNERREVYESAQAALEAFGPEWRPDHGRIITAKNTLGYWDDWDQKKTIHNLPFPSYEHRRTAYRHVYSASPKLVVELMDEIAALKAEIDNRADGISLAEVKINEA